MSSNIRVFKDLFRSTLYYKLDQFCDATIVTEDGEEFKAHKLFLSKGSEYFQAFFRSKSEKEEKLFLAFDKPILENILIFLYTGEVHLDDQNIAAMMIASDYLLIDSLLTHCKYFAFRKISIQCCLPLLIASYVVERLGVTEYCYRFVLVHFGSLVSDNCPDIAELPLSTLIKLLRDDSLGVVDEDSVWKAIVIWVNGDSNDRLKDVPELLSSIRWRAVSSLLASCIAVHPIFRENVFCRGLDLEKLANNSEDENIQESFLPNRFPRKMYVFMCRKTSPYPSGTLELYLTYDDQLDIWRKIGETDTNFHTLIAKDRFVFMFNTISNKMTAFDLIKKEWAAKNNLRSSRQGYCIAQTERNIFAVGGFIFMSNTQLSEVEYYDATRDAWSYCKPVPPINICGASVVREALYVIGYLENVDNLEMRALVYDRAHDIWSDVNKPEQFRTSFAVINFHDQLYILGGRTEENNATTSIERFDAEKGEWESFPALPFPYELPHAVILKDKLMVFDDCPGGMTVPRFSPSTWNEERQAWEVESIFSPFNEIHRYEFCSVDDRSTLRRLTKENRDPDTTWSKTSFVPN